MGGIGTYILLRVPFFQKNGRHRAHMGPYGPIWAHTEPKSGVTTKHLLKPSPENDF